MVKAEREKRNQQIVELRKQGKSQRKIAEELNLTLGCIAYVCKQYGVGGQLSNNKRDYSTNKDLPQSQPDELKAISRIKAIGGFDYIGGYTNSDGYVTLRCQICGTEFERSYVAIRHQHLINCPGCQEIKRNKEKEEMRIRREAEMIEKQMAAWRSKLASRKKKLKDKPIHECSICGKPTDNRNCCSDKCQKIYTQRTHDQRRRARIRDAVIDKDIQLMELFRRDKGVCHICGGECDINDFMISDDGHYITGNNYPTIDHVIPLAKGGKHSWDNVKLAHFICNSKKHTKLMPPSAEKRAMC